MLTFPRNRRKAIPMGIDWEKEVFVDIEVRKRPDQVGPLRLLQGLSLYSE